jgi:hypothetical protein
MTKLPTRIGEEPLLFLGVLFVLWPMALEKEKQWKQKKAALHRRTPNLRRPLRNDSIISELQSNQGAS